MAIYTSATVQRRLRPLKGLVASVLGVLLTASALLGSASPASAAATKSTVVMPCLNESQSGYVFDVKPTRCTLHFTNRPRADKAYVVRLRWRGWGSSTAVAHGEYLGYTGNNAPTTITVSDLQKCASGGRDYSRATITLEGHTYPGTLAPCAG
jgi:hypothetical protein